MKTEISVIIPTHRRPRELTRAINSVISQTYSSIEILVVNDDKDSALKVLNIIGSFNDPRIKYLDNERFKGGNGARNTGILRAQGHYIHFLDDDDEFLPTRLEEIYAFLKENRLQAGFTNYYFNINGIDHKAKAIGCPINLENYLFGKISLCSSSNLCIEKNLIYKIGYWNEQLKRHQDLEYLVRVLANSNVGYLDKLLLRVNGHRGNPSPELIRESKERYFNLIQPQIQHIGKKIIDYHYAIHYRSLALAYGDQGKIKKMFSYGLESIKYKILSPEKYVRFLLCILKVYLKIDLTRKWKILAMIWNKN